MENPPSAASGEPAPRAKAGVIALAAALIVALGFAIYLNGARGEFIFDDQGNVVKNASIRQLWPSWKIIFQGRRPVNDRSFAVNYAIGELDPFGYHLANIAIHVAAALALFGIVRRTLLSAPMRARFGSASLPLALAVALVWLAHPIQSESVTYIAQRTESLMGLFYLLTLYCAIRATDATADAETTTADAETRGRGDAERKRKPFLRVILWQVAAVAACALGMGTKEVMISAPLIVLLYDRTFAAGSFRRALGRSAIFYLALALTALILPVLSSQAPPASAAPSAGFGMTLITPRQYALTQFGVIAHYLRLAFWPSPLILDYRWRIATAPGEILPWALLIGGLLAATLWALLRAPDAPAGGAMRRAAGFLGAWFFLVLAPTSSVMPIADLCFEHRMYLSLAPLAALAVCGGYALLTRRREEGFRGPAIAGALVLAALIAVFSWLTVVRNRDYRDELTMWGDILTKRPGNERAHNNYGSALMKLGKFQDALEQFQTAVTINKDYAEAQNNLGKTLTLLGHAHEAVPHFAEAVRLHPDDDRAQYNFGYALLAENDFTKARAHLEISLQLDGSSAEAHTALAAVLLKQGKREDGLLHLKEAARLQPDQESVHCNLAGLCDAMGRHDEAIAEYRAALRLNPDSQAEHTGLARALIAANRIADAVEECRAALRLHPDWVEVMGTLAWQEATHADARFRNGPEALKLALHATELTGGKDISCLVVLAAAYAETGAFAEAQQTLEKSRSLALAQGDTKGAEIIAQQLALYAAGKPYRQPAPGAQ